LNEATLTILALKNAVNSELTNLEEVLPKALTYSKRRKNGSNKFSFQGDAMLRFFFKERKRRSRDNTFKPGVGGRGRNEHK